MSLHNDATELKKLLEDLMKILAEGGTTTAEPTTEPAVTPAEPTQKPGKPSSPIKQVPGIQPKPKAFNQDVELFLQKRGLAEGSEQFSGSIWGNRPAMKCYKCGGQTYMDEVSGNTKCKGCNQNISYCNCGQNESIEFGAAYRAEWREAAKEMKARLIEAKFNVSINENNPVVVQGAVSKSHDFPIGLFWWDFSDSKLIYYPYTEGLYHTKTKDYAEQGNKPTVVRGRLFKDGGKNVIIVYTSDFKTFPMSQDNLNRLAREVTNEVDLPVSYVVNEIGQNLIETKIKEGEETSEPSVSAISFSCTGCHNRFKLDDGERINDFIYCPKCAEEQRESIGEAWKDHPDPSGFMRAAHDPKNCLLVFWYNMDTAQFIKSRDPNYHHSYDLDQGNIKAEELPTLIRGRVFEYQDKAYLMVYWPKKKNLISTQLLDIFDKAYNSVDKPITQVIDDNGDDISNLMKSTGGYKINKSKLGSWKISEGKVIEASPFTGVHPEKKKWIKAGDEQLNKILPELSDTEKRYLETVASESYAETVKRVEDYTGIKVQQSNLPSLVYLLMQTLEDVKSVESKNSRRLEELALQLVFSVPEFTVVEEAYMNEELGFDIKLAPAELGKLNQQPAKEDELSKDEELNLGLADLFKDETDEDLRRRFSNLMITGGSINKLYLFNMAVDKLAKMDANLPTQYGILASVAQIGYWVTPFGIEQAAAQSEETSAGSEEVIPQGDKYLIKVRGTTFPYLVHELVKGIYEYLALDPSQQIAMQKDEVEDETKDVIAGPGVYKTVTSYIPADKQELIPIVQKKLTGLMANDIQDVIAKNAHGQQIMNGLIADAEREWGTYRKQKEEYRA